MFRPTHRRTRNTNFQPFFGATDVAAIKYLSRDRDNLMRGLRCECGELLVFGICVFAKELDIIVLVIFGPYGMVLVVPVIQCCHRREVMEALNGGHGGLMRSKASVAPEWLMRRSAFGVHVIVGDCDRVRTT